MGSKSGGKLRKRWLVAALVTLAVLVIPIPTGAYKDGGTRVWTALTYKIVRWNRLTEDGTYQRTRLYVFPEHFRSIDSLWEREEKRMKHTFLARVLKVNGALVTVEPDEKTAEWRSSNRIQFHSTGLEKLDVETGTYVTVTYTGRIAESNPAQINVTAWAVAKNLRQIPWAGSWLEGETTDCSDTAINHVVITKIYQDCFFAETVIPSPHGN